MIFALNDDLVFPDPSFAEEDGLLAVGGDLSVERLLLAYRSGIFPWYSEDEPILWYAPKRRFVLFPEKIKISKSLAKKINEGVLKITENKAFESVISQCASIRRNGQNGTWITTEMKEAYCKLHSIGVAKSIEVWKGEELVGGLYGVEVRDVFCGESMFHKVSDASKMAMAFLATQKNYRIIDCQVYTQHLESLGATFISPSEYLKYLNKDEHTVS